MGEALPSMEGLSASVARLTALLEDGKKDGQEKADDNEEEEEMRR